MIQRIALIFLVLFTLDRSHAKAQVNDQVWFEYMLNYPFRNNWNVELAGTYSTVLQSPKWRAFDVEITPEVVLSPHIDLSASFTASSTKQVEDINTLEARSMVAARFHFTPNKRLQTRAYIRLENRNMQNTETNEWEQSNRARIKAETIYPINRLSIYNDKMWYTILDGEAFVVVDEDVSERFANRIRIHSGIGYRLSYSLRFEFILTLQRSKNTIEDDFNRYDNVFRFRLKQFLHPSKPAVSKR